MHWNRRVPRVLVSIVTGLAREQTARSEDRPETGDRVGPAHIGAGARSPNSAALMTSMQPGPNPVAVTSVNEWTSPPRPNSGHDRRAALYGQLCPT